MTIQREVRAALSRSINNLFEIDLGEVPLEVPPRAELGDLASPVAFELAKRLKASTGEKQNPRNLAARIAAAIVTPAAVARVDIAGAGYINIFLDRTRFLSASLDAGGALSPVLGGKLIVEHTAVNPNKAAHIGHVRNAVLGDTIVRIMRSCGETVEVQNYIDNTGVQVADVVVGFMHIDGRSLAELRAITGRFDYYCWDLYAKVGDFYAQDKSRLELRSRTLHELESGAGEAYEIADYVSARILNCHLDTMFRLGIKYDLLPRESDVLHLKIWDRAFHLLKERQAIEFETEGRLAGCWVMRSAENGSAAGADTEHEADKVIVRSNGTVTYTGKDIAFHLWKLGVLGDGEEGVADFYYRRFREYPDGTTAWITASEPSDQDAQAPRFGRATAYFNVIDIGQSYPQQCVKQAIVAVDRDERVRRSAHLAYEKVVLSASAAAELGLSLAEAEARGAVSMSGRKGLGVKADDLIDRVEEGALAEVAKRHAEMPDADKRRTAHLIAVAAVRYFLLKYTRTSTIAFDFKEALTLEGETGPYIQYAVTRANSIFRNLDEAGLTPDYAVLASVPRDRVSEILEDDKGNAIWALLYLACRLPDAAHGAIQALEPAVLAKYAFQLAQSFSAFYHKHRILQEPDAVRRTVLAAVTSIVRRQLVAALGMLGIEAPEVM